MITCLSTDKSYVGITRLHPNARWAQHRAQARAGRKTALANAIRKYGPENFVVAVLCLADDEECAITYERHYIADCQTLTPNGYNLTTGGETQKGLTPEARRKISEATRGRVVSPETRVRMSESRKGRKLTLSDVERARRAAQGRKIGEAWKGVPLSEERRQKLREANLKRYPLENRKPKTVPPEQRRAAQRANQAIATAAAQIANLGRKRPAEEVAKIVSFHTGRKRSMETRAKLSEKARERAARDPAAAAAKAAMMRAAKFKEGKD